jgi:hypothetical protein
MLKTHNTEGRFYNKRSRDQGQHVVTDNRHSPGPQNLGRLDVFVVFDRQGLRPRQPGKAYPTDRSEREHHLEAY